MEKLIGYCGLNCRECEAYRATVDDDNGLRERVAKHWSELNGVEITPEMINCLGCRAEGVKTPFCEFMCPVRKCAEGRGIANCSRCAEFGRCEIIAEFIRVNPKVLENLKG